MSSSSQYLPEEVINEQKTSLKSKNKKFVPEKTGKVRKLQFIFHVVQAHIQTKTVVSRNQNKLSKHTYQPNPKELTNISIFEKRKMKELFHITVNFSLNPYKETIC